jgi:hypothetical protein
VKNAVFVSYKVNHVKVLGPVVILFVKNVQTRGMALVLFADVIGYLNPYHRQKFHGIVSLVRHPLHQFNIM